MHCVVKKHQGHKEDRKTYSNTRIFGIGKVGPKNSTKPFKVSGEQIMRDPFTFIKKVTELLVFQSR